MVAIMQVGVVVFGVLVAGIWHREQTMTNMLLPVPVMMLYSYGVMGLFVPMIWSVFALVLIYRPEVSEEIKSLVFWFGVLLLIALAVFVVYANLSPLFRIMWGLNGDDNG